MLKNITQSPYLNLLCGAILLISAGYEIWLHLGTEGLRAHHGIALVGLIQILRSVPEILEGVNHMGDAKENFFKEVDSIKKRFY